MEGREEWRNWRGMTDMERLMYELGRSHGLKLAYRRAHVAMPHRGYQTYNDVDWSYAITLDLMAKMEPSYLVRDPNHEA